MVVRSYLPIPFPKSGFLLPGTSFLINCSGYIGAAHSDFLWSIWPALLKPPGDGFHEHGHGEVGYKLIGKWRTGSSDIVLPEGQARKFFEQFNQGRAHLQYKPGTAFPAKQSSIEPFILRNVFEELNPNLRRMCCNWL